MIANSNPAGVKPRVLIIANAASWIIGQMAMHIIRQYSDRYEFWFLTDKMFRLRPDLVRALLPSMDFVFPLSDKSHNLLHDAAQSMKVPPSLLWVHHVTSWNAPMKEAVGESAELITCTQDWKERIELQYPARHPVTVVPHGVDSTALYKVSSQRAHFSIPADSFVIGFVGSKTSNFDEGRKGLDTLHTILQTVKARIPNLHVSFLGLGWEQEVRMLRAQGVSANYVGFIPESRLRAFYSSIDAYLMTSRVEGGPCTVLESMACETPVVATRVGLVPEVVVDGQTGFSAEIGDAETMSAQLCRLAASAELRNEIGTAARAKIVDARTWTETLRALEAPFARMHALSNRSLPAATPASERRAAQFASAVHTVDGLMWGLASWSQRLVTAPAAVRLIRSCWAGRSAADVMRGLALAARLAFRPSALRKLLQQEPRMSPTLSFADQKKEECRSAPS
jgi:glycosyltransferase involved in cell wall biosynthesis